MPQTTAQQNPCPKMTHGVLVFSTALCFAFVAIGSSAPALAATDEVRADRFSIAYEIDGSDLMLHIDTDLPDEAELSVSVNRTYYQASDGEAYSRAYFSEFEPVSDWRKPRRISLDSDKWKKELRAHQDEMARIGAGLAFEIGRIEPTIEIRAVLHLNQDAPQFGGIGNPNLSGTVVKKQGKANIIKSEVEVPYPLDGPAPSGKSRFADHSDLQVNSEYTLSAGTPLMSEFEPRDPIGALDRTEQLSAGTIIRVTEVRSKMGFPWYRVETGSGSTGWINSAALARQEIQRVH